MHQFTLCPFRKQIVKLLAHAFVEHEISNHVIHELCNLFTGGANNAAHNMINEITVLVGKEQLGKRVWSDTISVSDIKRIGRTGTAGAS
jgi:hypothetical protein